MRRTAISVVALALLPALTSLATAQTSTYTDANFLDSDWTLTTEVLNLGGSVTGNQVATGGTSGSYRRIVNTLNSAIGFGFANTVYGFHARAGAVFTPSASGPISSIDYSESSIRLAGGGQQACGVALKQNGVIYYGPAFLNPSTVNVWAPTSQPGLTAASFDALAPGVQNPDFSAGGTPIQFGFYRANSTSVGGGGSTPTGGIDDWAVSVHYDGATPARVRSWGSLKAAYAGRR
jgi:hypothetical protein